jgi:hypothetical protein
MFCREHVVQLHREMDRIHQLGAELVVIGNGTPNFIAGFREHTGYQGPLYVDPSLASYTAAGMKRALWRIFTPQTLAYGVRALVGGHRQGRTRGDQEQQGGVLVIAPPGRIIHEHQSKVAGDNEPPARIVAALERQAA